MIVSGIMTLLAAPIANDWKSWYYTSRIKLFKVSMSLKDSHSFALIKITIIK